MMPMALHTHAGIWGWIGKAWPQRGVRPAAVVMKEPGTKSFLKMLLVQRDNPIQTFTPKCANQPFAQRISLGAVNRRLYDFKAETSHRRIECKGEDGVVVMEDKPVGMVSEGMTSRSCWRVQAALGWAVALT